MDNYLFLDIRLGRFLERSQSSIVVFHPLLDKRLSDVCFDERWIDLDGCFGVFQCFRESHELCAWRQKDDRYWTVLSGHSLSTGTVVECSRVGRKSPDGLGIRFDSRSKVSSLSVSAKTPNFFGSRRQSSSGTKASE